MLDIKFIKEHSEEIKKTAKNKNINIDVDRLIATYKKKNKLMQEIERLKALKNDLNEMMKSAESDEKREIIKKGKEIKKKLEIEEPEYKKTQDEFRSLMLKIPNIISEDTPIGKDESENVVLRKVGEPKKFSFEPKDHVILGENLGIIDIDTATKISGARFNYLKGEAVLLQFAIIQFVFSILTDKKIISELAKKVSNPSDKPFTPVVPPVMIKSEIAKKMDRFDPIEDRYYLPEDDLLLVGSAEHSLGPIFMNQTIQEKDLPIRFIGYSTAFRREAGSYGKDMKGILRVHQFDKLEMESFTTAENGQVEQNLIVALQEYILGQIGIPYQVVSICSGDMGKPDYRQIDIECWIPSQNKYRETHTSDYMTDFQARRLNAKVIRENGKTELMHMNDATASAIGRMLIAILENYQQKDGSVVIPEVLRKYMPGNIEVIKKK